MKRLLTLCCGLTLSAFAWAEQTVYLQSLQATLLAQPRFGSQPVARLGKGTELTQLDARGNWRLVRYGEQQGWLPRLVLSRQPPLNKVSVLDQQESLQQKARRRSSTIVTAGAARGLASEDRARRSATQFANYDALRQMEAQQLSEDAALRFLAEGLTQ